MGPYVYAHLYVCVDHVQEVPYGGEYLGSFEFQPYGEYLLLLHDEDHLRFCNLLRYIHEALPILALEDL